MQQLDFLLRYTKYLLQAKNKFDIHSPFLFDLTTNILNDKLLYDDYYKIEKIKRQLLNNKKKIEVLDLGAGSTTGNNKLRSISNIARYSSKSKKYGRLLYRLSKHLKPENILELGTAMGISSAYLAMGHEGSQITSIEGCPNISDYAIQNIASLGIRNTTVLNRNFDEALPAYLKSCSHLDLAFIDGNHREGPTINYFEQCLLKTTNDSCIIFDDIHWSAGMENAWKSIASNKSVSLSIDLFHIGIVFFRKELSKQHFVIRF